MHHILPSSHPLSPFLTSLRRNVVARSVCIAYWFFLSTFLCMQVQEWRCMAKCSRACGIWTHEVCVCVFECVRAQPSLVMGCVWRAIWSPLTCRGPCEVLSAWPLWSPVATGGLLHSTSNPGSRPQKRKFGSHKWRGCSWAIYRAPYWSSTTHIIPYENERACGACGACEYWGVAGREWRWRGKQVYDYVR